MADDCGFVIFSGNKLWYSSKEGMENSLCKSKSSRGVTKIRNSAKNKRVVHYPIFNEIMKNETDPFWVSFFDDAATNNLPRNFRFNKNCLSYHIKTKNIDLQVPEDPFLAAMLIKKFLLDNAGIISPDDLHAKRLEQEKQLSEMLDSEINYWSQIRSEKQQSILISLFVEKVGEYYSLDINERKVLMQNIKIGVLAGYFNNDNIKLVGNQIIQINGLEYDDDNKKFGINYEVCKISKTTKKNVYDETTFEGMGSSENVTYNSNKNSLLKHWQRYLLDLSKKSKL